MKLNQLTDGERFQIVRTGERGRLIGMFGDKRRRVVVLDTHPRLTNYNFQLEVKRL